MRANMVKPPRTAVPRDAIGAVAIVIGLSALFIVIDLSQTLLAISNAYPWLGMSGVLAIAPAVAFAAALYALRRRDGERRSIAEAKRANAALECSNAALAEANTALVKTKHDLERANRAKDEFLNVMSHELRTPLNGVLPMAELLRETLSTPGDRRAAELIHESGLTLLSMVDDVLEYARLTTGEAEDVRMIRFDLRDCVARAVDAHQPAAAAKALKLSFDGPAGPPLWLLGDGARLHRLLTRLLDNAIRFTMVGGVSVTVAMEGAGDNDVLARIRVSDSGEGMAEIEKIFDAFSQEDYSNTRKSGGMGIGLALCRAWARSLNGDLGVESVPGRGSSFFVHARFARMDAPAAARTLEML